MRQASLFDSSVNLASVLPAVKAAMRMVGPGSETCEVSPSLAGGA